MNLNRAEWKYDKNETEHQRCARPEKLYNQTITAQKLYFIHSFALKVQVNKIKESIERFWARDIFWASK